MKAQRRPGKTERESRLIATIDGIIPTGPGETHSCSAENNVFVMDTNVMTMRPDSKEHQVCIICSWCEGSVNNSQIGVYCFVTFHNKERNGRNSRLFRWIHQLIVFMIMQIPHAVVYTVGHYWMHGRYKIIYGICGKILFFDVIKKANYVNSVKRKTDLKW